MCRSGGGGDGDSCARCLRAVCLCVGGWGGGDSCARCLRAVCVCRGVTRLPGV